jgi:protein gp37
MGAKTSIEWTDGGSTWNPIRARNRETDKVGWFCVHESDGCKFCYAEAINRRLGTRVDYKAQNLDRVYLFLDEEVLMQPLRWKRPRKIFPNSMTDWMADFVPDEWIDKMMAVMALCPHHTFLPLTKRAERMRDYCKSLGRHHTEDRVSLALKAMAKRGEIPVDSACWYTLGNNGWNFQNVWLGVSVEDQRRADERIPLLLDTPAAVRWISAEPLLEAIDIEQYLRCRGCGYTAADRRLHGDHHLCKSPSATLDWVVIGGESGTGARPFNIEWARSIIAQCKAAGVPVFMKQLGSVPILGESDIGLGWPDGTRFGNPRQEKVLNGRCILLRDRKGGDISEWHPDLRVREFPAQERG